MVTYEQRCEIERNLEIHPKEDVVEEAVRLHIWKLQAQEYIQQLQNALKKAGLWEEFCKSKPCPPS